MLLDLNIGPAFSTCLLEYVNKHVKEIKILIND